MTVKEWTRVMELYGWHYEDDGWWHFRDVGSMGSTLPSPSLDLMHKLEGELDENEFGKYVSEIKAMQLEKWNKRYRKLMPDIFIGWLLLNATAEQKARAWLKVKDK